MNFNIILSVSNFHVKFYIRIHVLHIKCTQTFKNYYFFPAEFHICHEYQLQRLFFVMENVLFQVKGYSFSIWKMYIHFKLKQNNICFLKTFFFPSGHYIICKPESYTGRFARKYIIDIDCKLNTNIFLIVKCFVVQINKNQIGNS